MGDGITHIATEELLLVTFVVLYRGQSLHSAELVAVATDPNLAAYVAAELLRHPPVLGDRPDSDAVISSLRGGKREALQLVSLEASSEGDDGAPEER